MKTVLLITGVRPLKVGNQSLIKNLKPLMFGYEIKNAILLRYTQEEVEKLKDSLKLNIFINQLQKKGVNNVIKGCKNNKKLNFNEVIQIENDVTQWRKNIPALIIHSGVGILSVLKLFFKKNHHYDLVIGYETSGIIVGKLLKLFFPRARFCSVFQGTTIIPEDMTGNLLQDLRLIFKRPLDWLAWKISSDLVLVTDDGTRGDVLARKCGIKDKNVCFLENASELNKYDFNKIQKVSNNKIVGICAMRLVNWKRIDRLIYILDALKKYEYKFYKKLNIIVIGDGPEKSNLIKLANDYGVDAAIKWRGSLNYNEVVKEVSRCDFSLTFSDISNVNNHVLDSINLGKPIVAVDKGSLNSIIEKYNAKSQICILNPEEPLKKLSTVFKDYIEKSINKIFNIQTMNVTQRDEHIIKWISNATSEGN